MGGVGSGVRYGQYNALKHGDICTLSGKRKVSVEYAAWINMKARCYNKKNNRYKNYGGRGIIVCIRWLECFENFLVDMGRKPNKLHSLDRKDNNGNYEPNNCRWSTKMIQANNRRYTKSLTINS